MTKGCFSSGMGCPALLAASYVCTRTRSLPSTLLLAHGWFVFILAHPLQPNPQTHSTQATRQKLRETRDSVTFWGHKRSTASVFVTFSRSSHPQCTLYRSIVMTSTPEPAPRHGRHFRCSWAVASRSRRSSSRLGIDHTRRSPHTVFTLLRLLQDKTYIAPAL